MPLTEQEEFELLSLEREKALNSTSQNIEQEQPQKVTPKGGDITAEMVGLAGLGGAMAAKKGYEWLRQPQIRKELGGIKEQLRGIQQQIPSELGMTSIEGTEATFIPKKLGEISQGLKQQLNAFDETLVSLKAKELSGTIKENFPSWIRSATDTYGSGLDQLDVHFNNSGKVFNNEDFIGNILDKTINQAKTKGVLDTDLNSLYSLKKTLTSEYPTNQISFSQAKGLVSGLVNENPYGATSGMLRENWGSYLEKNAPKEISDKLTQLNNQYKKFAQARTQLQRVVDPKTGEFNTSKLNNYLVKYTKQRVDEGVVDLMKMLGEGSELTQPIRGVSEKFKGLSELRVKRFTNEDAINQQIDKVNKLRLKSEELISRGKVAQEKIDSRNVAKALAKTFGLGRKAMGMLSIIPQITDAIRYSQDPEAYTAALEGEISQEELQKARKRYQTGEMTEEEKIKYGIII